MFFKSVYVAKPYSSRNSSIEAFIVCKNYSPPAGFDPKLLSKYLDTNNKDFSDLTGINRVIVPFLICGDFSAYDSDTTYSLQLEGELPYKYHEPVQPPLQPPSAEFKNMSLSSNTGAIAKDFNVSDIKKEANSQSLEGNQRRRKRKGTSKAEDTSDPQRTEQLKETIELPQPVTISNTENKIQQQLKDLSFIVSSRTEEAIQKHLKETSINFQPCQPQVSNSSPANFSKVENITENDSVPTPLKFNFVFDQNDPLRNAMAEFDYQVYRIDKAREMKMKGEKFVETPEWQAEMRAKILASIPLNVQPASPENDLKYDTHMFDFYNKFDIAMREQERAGCGAILREKVRRARTAEIPEPRCECYKQD